MQPRWVFTILMMKDARLHDLFTPLTIGSLSLRNRFAMAPMTRGASPGGIPGVIRARRGRS